MLWVTSVNNAKKYGKVAVLMGGLSAERDISLKSGHAVLAALQTNGVDAHGVDVDREVVHQLLIGKYDRVFNMLHGRGGEDGVIQGTLELLGIPYTGSGVLASAVGMDKLKTKEIWIANQLPTPAYCVIDKNTLPKTVLDKLALPLIIKPMREGSSIGMSKVSKAEDLEAAIVMALEYDAEVLAEQWVEGKEYTLGIVGDLSLPAIRLETTHDFYDYDAKYESHSTQYHCPCGLEAEIETRFQQLAMDAFHVIDGKGWGRVDMMMDDNGDVYLIEVNTLPGMTDHSLLPMAAKQVGLEFDALVIRILDQSFETSVEKSTETP